jgi:hypothetical protein
MAAIYAADHMSYLGGAERLLPSLIIAGRLDEESC